MKKKILTILIISLFFIPIRFINDSFFKSTVEAKCGDYCNGQKIADNIWGDFNKGAKGGGSATGQIPQPFGGEITTYLWCYGNASIAFYINSKYGPIGPYTLYPYGGGYKSYYAAYPGNHVLGASTPMGECVIYVGPYRYTYITQQTVTTYPGMGTSLTP